MYLVVNNAETENNESIYLVLTFKPNSVNVSTYTEKELTQLYTSCKLNREAINIRIDDAGRIGIKLGTTGRGKVPILKEYAGISTFVPISSHYVWSIIANAVTDDAQLIVDGKNMGEITLIDFDTINNFILLNGVKYSQQSDRNKLSLKYKTCVPIDKLYSKLDKECCKIDYSTNTVTFDLTRLLYSAQLKGILKFISPPLRGVVDSILSEYQWVRRGYIAACEKISSGLELFDDNNENVSIVLNSLGDEVNDNNRDYLLEGIMTYILYGEKALINAKPENQYMFRCLEREYNMIMIYSNYLDGR